MPGRSLSRYIAGSMTAAKPFFGCVKYRKSVEIYGIATISWNCCIECVKHKSISGLKKCW